MRSLKNGFRDLEHRLQGRRVRFKTLWPEVQNILANNILVLANEFTTNDLWLYARRRGWIQETPRGTFIVSAS